MKKIKCLVIIASMFEDFFENLHFVIYHLILTTFKRRLFEMVNFCDLTPNFDSFCFKTFLRL